MATSQGFRDINHRVSAVEGLSGLPLIAYDGEIHCLHDFTALEDPFRIGKLLYGQDQLYPSPGSLG